MPNPLPQNSTIHIVDDDNALRDSLRLLFRASDMAAEAYDSGESFLERLPAIRDGCVLIDVNMPGMSGLELLSAIKRTRSVLPCIIMTGFGEISLAVKAMKAGAADFIEKPFEDEILMEAVQNALGKRTAVHPGSRVESRLARLTPRELDVMAGMAQGQQNKRIALELGISPRTVEIHRARLMTKLEAGSVADVIRIALQSGMTAN